LSPLSSGCFSCTLFSDYIWVKGAFFFLFLSLLPLLTYSRPSIFFFCAGAFPPPYIVEIIFFFLSPLGCSFFFFLLPFFPSFLPYDLVDDIGHSGCFLLFFPSPQYQTPPLFPFFLRPSCVFFLKKNFGFFLVLVPALFFSGVGRCLSSVAARSCGPLLLRPLALVFPLHKRKV